MKPSTIVVSIGMMLTAALALHPEVLSADFVLEEAGGACVICHEDCPEGEHIAANGGYTLPLNWRRNGGAHNGLSCMSGSCATKHGPEGCGGGMLQQTDVEDLESALLAGTIPEVQRLLESFPANLTFNASRAAVQVRDCTGGLIAHIPVDSSLVTTLTE